MSAAVYERSGRVVCWISEAGDLFDRSNVYRGFIQEDKVFNSRGRYLGEFIDGYFWDKHGRAVAFVDGASGGPIPPIPQIPPIPPIHPIPPIRSIPAILSIPLIHSFNWSGETFEEFLSSN